MRTTVALMACVLLCAGCLSPKKLNPTLYYTLEPALDIPAAGPTGLTLGVRPFSVARPYGSGMAYLDGAHRMGYRVMEEWAEMPREAVTRAVMDAVSATGRFADVGNAAEMALPDYMLTGEVRKFHEDRSKNPAAAVLEARFELRRPRVKDGVWGRTISVEKTLQNDSGAALAAAMSEAIADLARQLADGVAQANLIVPETP